MAIRLFKNPYKKALEKSAALISPEDDAAEKLLGAVMLSAGVTAAVSMGSASAKASALAKAAMVKLVGGVAAVTVTVTASVVGVAYYSAPSIKDVLIEQGGWTQSKIVVVTDRKLGEDEDILIIPEEGPPLSAIHESPTRHVATVYRNGVYQVELAGREGKGSSAQVTVDGIDTQIPVMEHYGSDETTVTIYFADDRSGVNWETISAADAAGRAVTPLEINSQEGYVRFTLPDSNLNVYLEDMAGNKGMTTIYVS